MLGLGRMIGFDSNVHIDCLNFQLVEQILTTCTGLYIAEGMAGSTSRKVHILQYHTLFSSSREALNPYLANGAALRTGPQRQKRQKP
jgi:hypothetical protein